jgi:hypothetical protein
MESLLEQIGLHPFLSVRQLCRMLNVSQSWIYDRLGELQRQGLVAFVNPRHPGIRARALYYLTLDGVAQLSLPRRWGRPRFLDRIATVYEVRNLFISMQRVGLPVLRWQTLTPCVDRVSLHGVALLDNRRQLVVEWDQGERPLKLWRRRLGGVAELAARTGTGLLLVAADDARGGAMLSILASQLGLRGPHLALTTRSMIAVQGVPDAPCYAPAIGDVLSLGGFVQTLPEPWGDRLPFSNGVMGFRGGWQGNTRLVVELSPLQKVLLSVLAALPLTTADDLAALSGRKSQEWIRRALCDLKRRGLVGEYVADPNLLERYYYPTYAGLGFLAAVCGTAARAYARARGWTVNRGEVSVSHLVRAFRHTQEAREIALALAREARRCHKSVTWYDEREAYVYFATNGCSRVLAPDARIHWGEQVLFVEVDRGTSSSRKLAGKVAVYYDYRHCAEHRRFGEEFRLLVVASHPYRERRWLELVSGLAARRQVLPLDVLTTTREAILEQGIDAPVWRGMEGDRRRFMEEPV